MMQASDLENRIETLAQWIFEASHLVVFTGAGISTESGLPDFRGPDGLWTRQAKGLPPPKFDWFRGTSVSLLNSGLCGYAF